MLERILLDVFFFFFFISEEIRSQDPSRNKKIVALLTTRDEYT